MLWQLVYRRGNGFGTVELPPSDRGVHRVLDLIAGRHRVRPCVRDTHGLFNAFEQRAADEFVVGACNRLVGGTLGLGPEEVFNGVVKRASEVGNVTAGID